MLERLFRRNNKEQSPRFFEKNGESAEVAKREKLPAVFLSPAVKEELEKNSFLQKAVGDIYELDDDLTARTSGAYDFDTYKHSLNIANLIAEKAEKLAIDPATAKLMIRAAIMHDVGKTKMPAEVLTRPTSLTPEEKAVHVRGSIEYLKDIIAQKDLSSEEAEDFEKLLYVVGGHHNEDGYPRKGQDRRGEGESIRLESERRSRCRRRDFGPETEDARRFFAEFDKYESLRSPRVYKGSRTAEEIESLLSRVFTRSEDGKRIEALLEKRPY
ncbi:MAG: HD domain-containing protein [Candidatus Falkowbacteria bacterium]